MIIAIDYDNTIDEAPDYFSKLIELSQDFGHNICIVTNNPKNSREDIENFSIENNVPIFYSGEINKEQFMKMRGVPVDVWIDDNPRSIVGIGGQS